MSYYRVIHGIRYDRSLLDKADEYVTNSSSEPLSLDLLQTLYELAKDGRRITETEQRTLLYIQENFKLSEEAKAWLKGEKIPSTPIDTRIKRVLQGEFGLKNIQWEIDEEEVRKQELLNSQYSFENALKGAVQAFAYTGRGYLNLAEFVPANQSIFDIMELGTLYLYPLDYQEKQQELPFEIPKFLQLFSIDQWWIFGMEIPEIPFHNFVASVKRDTAVGFSESFFSEKPSDKKRVTYILKDLLKYPGMEWEIDFEEARKQEEKYTNQQGWAAAMYLLLDRGVFNGESSISMYDQVVMEEWFRSFDDYRQRVISYLQHATVSLITEDFPEEFNEFLSEFNQLYIDTFWYFLLIIPNKPDWRVLLSKNRLTNGIDDTWNDVYKIDPGTDEEKITRIITQEFKVPNLQWFIDLEEFQSQTETYGPDWRGITSVLRQTMNTILQDYTTMESPFQLVSEVHFEEFNPEEYTTMALYRAAVSEKVREYLNSGKLYLVSETIFSLNPDDLGDVYPPEDGETLENQFIFQLSLPTLSDHLYWVIIPRWPDYHEEGMQPYVYGFN